MKEIKLITPDKIISNDRFSNLDKKFLIGLNLSVTDIWRSKMEGRRIINDF